MLRCAPPKALHYFSTELRGTRWFRRSGVKSLEGRVGTAVVCPLVFEKRIRTLARTAMILSVVRNLAGSSWTPRPSRAQTPSSGGRVRSHGAVAQTLPRVLAARL